MKLCQDSILLLHVKNSGCLYRKNQRLSHWNIPLVLFRINFSIMFSFDVGGASSARFIPAPLRSISMFPISAHGASFCNERSYHHLQSCSFSNIYRRTTIQEDLVTRRIHSLYIAHLVCYSYKNTPSLYSLFRYIFGAGQLPTCRCLYTRLIAHIHTYKYAQGAEQAGHHKYQMSALLWIPYIVAYIQHRMDRYIWALKKADLRP